MPAVPVAVNVSGLPDKLPDDTRRVLDPAVVPSVHEVADAMPLELLVAAAPVTTAHPPVMTVKVTVVPATTLLFASLTITDGTVDTAVFTVAV